MRYHLIVIGLCVEGKTNHIMPTMTKIKSVAMLLAGLYVAFLAFLAFVAFSLTLKSICVALNVSFYVLLIVHFVLHVGLRSRHWIGIGSRTEMDWIGMGLPSRYVLLLMFHSICDAYCPFRFARWLSQSSLDWNWL